MLYINFGAIESEIEQCRSRQKKETEPIETNEMKRQRQQMDRDSRSIGNGATARAVLVQEKDESTCSLRLLNRTSGDRFNILFHSCFGSKTGRREIYEMLKNMPARTGQIILSTPRTDIVGIYFKCVIDIFSVFLFCWLLINWQRNVHRTEIRRICALHSCTKWQERKMFDETTTPLETRRSFHDCILRLRWMRVLIR